MDVREVGWVSRVDAVVSRSGLVAGSCEYGDEPPGTGATELVYLFAFLFFGFFVPVPDVAD
jgi:hypothetical protein